MHIEYAFMQGFGMNWEDLRLVLAIARSGSLSAAAKTLGVNQTTVGRRLTAAEERLGAPMFIRNRSGFRLTEAGDAALAQIEVMESAAMRLTESVGAEMQAPTGVVRIATMPWIFNYLIIPALPDLARRFPNISIHAISGLRERSLSDREAELALRFEMQPHGQERSFEIAEVPYAVYSPVDRDAKKVPWVGLTADVDSSEPGQWLKMSNKESSLQDGFKANDSGLIYEAICTGVGKGLLPEVLGEGASGLARLSGEDPEITRRLRVMVHPDVERFARVEVIIEWLKEILPSSLRRFSIDHQ